jgi:hypothetical protein
MTVLIYLGHPAHFHLFKHTIKNLQSKSHKVVIVIKSKDVLEKLLVDSNLPYINVYENYNTQNQKPVVLFYKRLKLLYKISRKYKPDKLIGSAAELTILGKLFRKPSYVFFEDDFTDYLYHFRTALERQKIEDELAMIRETIAYLEDLLSHPEKILSVIGEELKKLKDKYADPRRTKVFKGKVDEFSEEDLQEKLTA